MSAETLVLVFGGLGALVITIVLGVLRLRQANPPQATAHPQPAPLDTADVVRLVVDNGEEAAPSRLRHVTAFDDDSDVSGSEVERLH